MKCSLYQVDAFTEKLFGGNPAAVCPLEEWLSDDLMQNIAMENNLSETAFFVETQKGFDLRWFTPTTEVDLCGHATLASAHVIFEHLGYSGETIAFHTKSVVLNVRKDGSALIMNFPAVESEAVSPPPFLFEGLGIEVAQVFKSDDYLVVLEREEEVADLRPDFNVLKKIDARGIIVTAPGSDCDFVSRFFGPRVGVNEDPVTGSAHTKLVPYWAERLDKTELSAHQISKRGGKLNCRISGRRVEIKGSAVTYLTGTIEI